MLDKKKKKNREPQVFDFNKNIETQNIGDMATAVMKIFGANNNLMRHLPAIIDGLKPGERRIIYTLFLMKAFPDRPFKKVAKAVGDTIQLHPHGDNPIKETLVKLSQWWTNIQPLIEGQGNLGSPMGDNSAAARYIEARLSEYAFMCFFKDFEKDFADMKDSYLGDMQEPEVLPSRYPNALINNTFGIGYGVSTGLPTYNLREVLEFTIKLLDDPEFENVVLIPDSPTWANVVDEGQFGIISETGNGKFKMRGEMIVDEETNNIFINSVPLQVSANDVNTDIIKLQKEGKIQGVLDIKIHTGRETDSPSGFDMEVILKKEIDPYSVISVIYTKTQMEKTFPVNFKLIDDYEDNDYNVRSLILSWIDHRRDFKRRVYNHKFIRAKERQHVLETLLMIFTGENAEKSLKVVRNAENRKEVRDYLMKTFKITSLQAENIADMKFTAFTKDSIKAYKKEKEKVDADAIKFEKFIRSAKKIDNEIREELEEGIKLFGVDRRSKVITLDGEVKIRDSKHIVVFTMDGFVKKLPAEGTSIGHINQGDYPIEICQVSNLTDLLIFDQTGKVSKLPVHSLTSSEIDSEGEKLSKYCTVNGNITTIIPKPTTESLDKIKQPVYFVMLTKNGIIKKTLVNSYMNIRNELLGMIVKDEDELRSVKILVGDKDILVYTNKGMGIRFPSSEVRDTERMSVGVKALDTGLDEVVVGMDIINDKDTTIFCLTNKGTGKKCTLDNFKTMGRASKPLRIMTLEEDEDVMIIRTVKGKEKFKAYLKNTVEEIDIAEVKELPRLSKGTKLIPVRKGEVIIDIKEVK